MRRPRSETGGEGERGPLPPDDREPGADDDDADPKNAFPLVLLLPLALASWYLLVWLAVKLWHLAA